MLASGKYRFMKNPSRSRPKAKTKRKSNPYRRKKTIARRKKGRRSRKFTIPIAPVIGLGVGLAEPAKYLMDGDWENAANAASLNYIGYDFKAKQMNWNRLVEGLIPLMVGIAVHKFVGGPPLNFNRMLANAGVPVFRI